MKECTIKWEKECKRLNIFKYKTDQIEEHRKERNKYLQKSNKTRNKLNWKRDTNMVLACTCLKSVS